MLLLYKCLRCGPGVTFLIPHLIMLSFLQTSAVVEPVLKSYLNQKSTTIVHNKLDCFSKLPSPDTTESSTATVLNINNWDRSNAEKRQQGKDEQHIFTSSHCTITKTEYLINDHKCAGDVTGAKVWEVANSRWSAESSSELSFTLCSVSKNKTTWSKIKSKRHVLKD